MEVNHRIKTAIKVLLLSVIVGFVLLVIVYTIPVELMAQKQTESARLLANETAAMVDDISGRVIDNYADSVTLALATYPGNESVFEKAVNAYYLRTDAPDPRESFVDITLNGTSAERIAYARYWHGSMVFIKPMMLFLNDNEIRFFNTAVLFFLITFTGIILIQKLPQCTIPFLLTMLLIAPTAVGRCFEYYWLIVITLIAIILLIWNPKGYFWGESVYLLFLGSGIATAYFDFLTAPTVSLTIPLALFCILRKDEKRFKTMLLCIVYWGMGYAGMWGSKWMIALIFEHGEFIDSLTSHVGLWASNTLPNTTSITRSGTLNKNFMALFKDLYIDLALAGYTILTVVCAIKRRKHINIQQINTCLLLYIPTLIGILWILMMASHSNVHTFFTYRTLAPCVFCILCGLDFGNMVRFETCNKAR